MTHNKLWKGLGHVALAAVGVGAVGGAAAAAGVFGIQLLRRVKKNQKKLQVELMKANLAACAASGRMAAAAEHLERLEAEMATRNAELQEMRANNEHLVAGRAFDRRYRQYIERVLAEKAQTERHNAQMLNDATAELDEVKTLLLRKEAQADIMIKTLDIERRRRRAAEEKLEEVELQFIRERDGMGLALVDGWRKMRQQKKFELPPPIMPASSGSEAESGDEQESEPETDDNSVADIAAVLELPARDTPNKTLSPLAGKQCGLHKGATGWDSVVLAPINSVDSWAGWSSLLSSSNLGGSVPASGPGSLVRINSSSSSNISSNISSTRASALLLSAGSGSLGSPLGASSGAGGISLVRCGGGGSDSNGGNSNGSNINIISSIASGVVQAAASGLVAAGPPPGFTTMMGGASKTKRLMRAAEKLRAKEAIESHRLLIKFGFAKVEQNAPPGFICRLGRRRMRHQGGSAGAPVQA